MEGILLVDKPQGMTSHDVVYRTRKALGIKKVGHAGTLDPLATGLLIMLVGKSTKLFDAFMEFGKAYRSTMILGTTRDTGDVDGRIIAQKSFDHISVEEIHSVVDGFKGVIKQIPPMYSALKVNGRKLYEYARQGIVIERQPREITIKELAIEKVDMPEVDFYTECSKGTYIRQLAEDMGSALGCGGCISKLRRIKIGPFHIDEAVRLEDIHENHLRHWPI